MNDPKTVDSAASQNEAPAITRSPSTGEGNIKTLIIAAIALLIIALFATALAHSQEIPDAPSGLKVTVERAPRTVDKKFIVVNAWSVAANMADAVTTRQAIGRGCTEANPLYGKQPGYGRLLAIKVPISGAILITSYALKKKYPRSGTWWILPVFTGALTTGASINNSFCH
jgi:hypothetical protein